MVMPAEIAIAGFEGRRIAELEALVADCAGWG